MQINKEQRQILQIDSQLITNPKTIIEIPDELFQQMLPNETYQTNIQKNMKFYMVNVERKQMSNEFVQSIHMAYQYHHPLALSPDTIWLAIMQGFAIHVTQNSEKLRKQFVDFEGKKDLVVERKESDLYKVNFYEAVDQFAVKIKENIGERLYKTCIPRFTTSDSVTLVAFQMTLMGAMEKYFKYTMVCGCGIPKVKLLGTLEDWILLRNHAEKLRVFDLDWWVDKLLIVLDKLIAAYKGEIDKDFWNDIYHYRQYQPSRGTPAGAYGWITYFFPYLQDYNQEYVKAELKNDIHIETRKIPNGQCNAPVQYVNLITKKSFPIQFRSGFFGVVKDEEGFLSPKIGWAVCKA